MSKIIETDIVIIGAGPVGLFTVFEAGLLGLDCHLIDNLDKVGGQCIELYPEKPIYDIPGVANQTGKEHIDALLEQIKPFSYETHLNQRVDVLEELPDNFWRVITNENTEFKTKNVFIAAGAGAFEPRKPPVEDPDKFLSKGVDYAIKEKDKYKDKLCKRDGRTNLANGFKETVNEYKRNKDKGEKDIASVLLFTDGVPTKNTESTDDRIDQMRDNFDEKRLFSLLLWESDAGATPKSAAIKVLKKFTGSDDRIKEADKAEDLASKISDFLK